MIGHRPEKVAKILQIIFLACRSHRAEAHAAGDCGFIRTFAASQTTPHTTPRRILNRQVAKGAKKDP
jgi:hypothetical protein